MIVLTLSLSQMLKVEQEGRVVALAAQEHWIALQPMRKAESNTAGRVFERDSGGMIRCVSVEGLIQDMAFVCSPGATADNVFHLAVVIKGGPIKILIADISTGLVFHASNLRGYDGPSASPERDDFRDTFTGLFASVN